MQTRKSQVSDDSLIFKKRARGGESLQETALPIVLDSRWMFRLLLVSFIYNEVFFKVEDKERVTLKLGFLGRK